MGRQVHGTEVAYGDLVGTGVQGDFRAQVRAVHHAPMLLGRAQIARVLERDPGVAGFEQHGEHLAPELLGRDFLEQLDFALLCEGFVMLVAFTEGVAVQVVQIRRIAGREQGPVTVFAHALDQQIGHPVRRIHVVGSAAFVAGILAQLQELLDVQVPAFQVGTHRAFTLAALVDRHGGIVDYFQEGHHALALAVGSLDVGAQRTNWRPVVTQTASPFRQHGVITDGAVDVFKIVAYRRQITGRQLRMAGTAVEQRGCGRHVVKRRQQVVKLDGPGIRVIFAQGQAHGNAHEKYLGQLQAGLVPVQEVTVVQGLQTQEAELQIPLRLKGSAEALQIESSQGFVQQFITNSRLDKGAQGLWINLSQWQTDGQAQGSGILQTQLFQQ